MTSQTNAMPEVSEDGFGFGPFRLEGDGTLWCENSIIHLTPKELNALKLLIAHPGRIVTPLQLKHALWGDVHVTADSVPKCMSALRARLHPHDCIQTVYKRGYRFAAEVRPMTQTAADALPRLAILPFNAGYSVPEHLGKAIAEEAIVRLIGLERPVVSVLARDSVFALSDNRQTAQQIGKALQADLVLTGTLTAMGAQFRLRAEMIRIEDGTQIWVEDVLVPQNKAPRLEMELVQRLLLRLNLGEHAVVAAALPTLERHRSPSHREAWEIYLRGHHEWQTMQRHRMQDALQHLQQALSMDSSLSVARIDIANLSTAQSLYGFLSPRQAAAEIRRVSIPALESQDPIEATMPAMGWLHFHMEHDLLSALEAFDCSAHLPHDQWTTHLRFLLTLSRHRFPEAIAMLHDALEVDPYAPWLNCRLAWALHLAGEAEKSVEQINYAINHFPHHEGAIFYGGIILSHNGQAERALQLANGLIHRISYFDMATASHAYALVCAGYRDEAQSILERMQWLSRERFVMSSFLPAVHAALGETDNAIATLRTAMNDRCPWFFQTLADPRLKPLHGHPEFEAMRAILPRMEAGLTAEHEPDMELCLGD